MRRYIPLVLIAVMAAASARSQDELSEPNVQVEGNRIIDFALPTLYGDGVVTPDDVSGAVYLLDFWALWCPPCIAERSELLRMHRMYGDFGFEIVSVSLDFDRSDVDLDRWPMPWHHAYLSPGEPETMAVMEAFGFTALPMKVLVGRDGRIRASGPVLRDEHLVHFLGEALE